MRDHSNTCVIIGIAGPSGSGKSTFTKALVDCISQINFTTPVQVIPEDNYYQDQSHLDFATRCEVNYDHPDAFEHDLLVSQLDQWKSGQAIEIPIYDYSLHNRCDKTLTVHANGILIVEGILVLHDPILRSRMDVKLFIDLPIEICLERRLKRDVEERDRDAESIARQFNETVRPMYHKFVEPSKSHADFVVPGNSESTTAIRVLSNYLVHSTSD
ncbi:MAG: uridine kinase [Planctomycetota bacterium]